MVHELPENVVSFHPCNIIDRAEFLSKMKSILDELQDVWNLTCAFMSPDEDPRGPEMDGEEDKRAGDVHGFCVTNYEQMMFSPEQNDSWGIWIFLNYKHVETLFRNDLTSLERRMVEWAAAVTLVHEIMHAISFIVPATSGVPVTNPDEDNPPPFFDSEALAEVGFSFEASINGGTTTAFFPGKSGFPYGHWFETKWPTVEVQEWCSSVSITLTNPDPYDYQERYPIPASFYEDIQQQRFWDESVNRFGLKLLFYRALHHGTRTDFTVGASTSTPIDFEPTSPVHVQAVDPGFGPTLQSLQERLWNVRGVRNIEQITVSDRLAATFAVALVHSSMMENAFWTESRNQRQSIDVLFEHCQRDDILMEEKVEYLEQLVDLVSTIVRNHEKTLDVLFVVHTVPQPNLAGVPNEQRRRTLLSWNRGTRIFVSECRSEQLITQEQATRLAEEAIALEICRMRLFTPDIATEVIRDGPDFHELALLIQLRRLLNEDIDNQSADRRMQLSRIEGRSLFSTLCLRFIEIALFPRGEITSEERAAFVREAQGDHRVFKILRLRAPKSWEVMFNIWEEVARFAFQTQGI
ncbi:hypothetical protein NHQ30_008409 [Ciborinia camelliae]|nr:hypothetical protein NHQ30_008409 [Ciborinia camelliae]